MAPHPCTYLRPCVSHYLMWCIWSEKNVRCYEGWEQSLLEIKSFFFHTLLLWSITLLHFSWFSLPVLLDHYNFGSWFLPPRYMLGFVELSFVWSGLTIRPDPNNIAWFLMGDLLRLSPWSGGGSPLGNFFGPVFI